VVGTVWPVGAVTRLAQPLGGESRPFVEKPKHLVNESAILPVEPRHPRYPLTPEASFVAPLALSLAAIVSTLAGGIFALRLARHLTIVFAFTTGVVFGIVAFDLLPEVFRLVHGHDLRSSRPMMAFVAAFLLFRAIEESLLARTPSRGEEPTESRRHPHDHAWTVASARRTADRRDDSGSGLRIRSVASRPMSAAPSSL
jgi:hypothetical protein